MAALETDPLLAPPPGVGGTKGIELFSSPVSKALKRARDWQNVLRNAGSTARDRLANERTTSLGYARRWR